MQTAILNMALQTLPGYMPETVLTFRPFIDYLRKRKNETTCHKSRFFSFVVEQFEKHPELLQPVDINKVNEHAELMQLVYTMLSPIVEDEEQHRWALCLPLKPVVFYSTNAFLKLVTNIATGNLRKSIITTQPGKIALVYFSQKEADEYINYIQYLQEQNVLMNDLEELALEEVQGVSGLEAMRVGIYV